MDLHAAKHEQCDQASTTLASKFEHAQEWYRQSEDQQVKHQIAYSVNHEDCEKLVGVFGSPANALAR